MAQDNLRKVFKDKIILVTGGSGSIGTELVRQLLEYEPKQLRIYSRDEGKHFEHMQKLNQNPRVRTFVGDIRDRDRLDMAFNGVEIVFHAAALKHVPLCEYNPFEAVKTNILGSQNIIDMALKHNVDSVIAISTDKAANPSNVMGTSKLMMEKLITNANFYRGWARTKFSCVRFGNVAWARGSVLPIWKRQAEQSGEITVTDHDMTRFMMSLPQAVGLVMETARLIAGGEIFILKMPSIKINDLAKLFINKHFPGKKIKIRHIGERPGEKKHEELFTNAVKPKAIFENEKMLVIIPEIDIYELKLQERKYPGFKRRQQTKEFTSKNSINHKKINAII